MNSIQELVEQEEFARRDSIPSSSSSPSSGRIPLYTFEKNEILEMHKEMLLFDLLMHRCQKAGDVVDANLEMVTSEYNQVLEKVQTRKEPDLNICQRRHKKKVKREKKRIRGRKWKKKDASAARVPPTDEQRDRMWLYISQRRALSEEFVANVRDLERQFGDVIPFLPWRKGD
eukprot:TRINITY_DN11205_c0_g2_i1.p1 TRINITY_DN11205_c0_g2~~TRINITY_DN11205_c0_g2_i1.p1  ORF type:complete len:182 (-),score=35.00 TRINITY_DN11205_c0_g2_i1:14-532(-)